jgi:hypothetical protein
MNGHECYHCKQWVAEGEHHDCWTTTEAALTQDLSEDLQDAYERLRDAAVEFGEQRVYASGSCIMFSRASCYFFVRPKRQWLELAIFLPRVVKAPQIKRVEPKSRVKFANIVRLTHRDEVEAPITDWLREAYDFEPLAKSAAKATAMATTTAVQAKTPKRKTATRKQAKRAARPKATKPVARKSAKKATRRRR